MAQVSGHDGRTSEGRTSNRGFASMNAERQRQIASMGGKAVPDEKRSFSQNRRLAAEAGRKGGQSVPGSKRSFSQNRELAATAGRKGGQSVPDEKRSFSQNPELAAEAGRKGGQASHGGGGADSHRESRSYRRACQRSSKASDQAGQGRSWPARSSG